jgi:hypothetical protein
VVKDGRVVKSLNSHDFTHYKLQPGEEFDFGDFRDAREFFTNAKPIIPMINQLKHDIATGNKVVMVTARADFNDRELFLDTFRKYGIDMNKVHVYRAGNFVGKASTEEKKKVIIRNLLSKDHYSKAIMYDDALPNLHAFVELKDEYPHTKFYAWQVSLDGEASEYQRTDEGLMSLLTKSAAKPIAKKSSTSLADIRAASQQTQDLLPPPHIRMYLHRIKDAKEKGIAPQFSASEYRELEQWVAQQKIHSNLPENFAEAEGTPSGVPHATRELIKHIISQVGHEGAHAIVKSLNWGDGASKELLHLIVNDLKQNVKENFADGKHPERKGLAKRSGVNTKASVSSLRNTAKHSSGEKQRMAHWLANMKAGRAKKK